MHFWKLLLAIGMVAWYLPVFPFRKNKYFLFFLINSLVDPIYIVLRYTFDLQTYNYLPFVFLIESITLPVNHLKSRIISSIALFLIIINLGSYPFLELVVCEVVLASMIYNILIDVSLEIKKEASFDLFQILLIGYFLRNVMMVYYYYTDPIFLMKHFTLFLLIIIVLPILITLFGPNKKISMNWYSKKLLRIFNIRSENPQLNLVQLYPLDFLKELTKTEIRVLSLLAEGYDSKEICDSMFISKRTVYFHLQNIKNKLNINSTVRLRMFAIDNRENLIKNQRPALINSIK